MRKGRNDGAGDDSVTQGLGLDKGDAPGQKHEREKSD